MAVMLGSNDPEVRKHLAGKLNPLCRKALENALGLCIAQTNEEVEIEHWLLKLLEPAESDLTRLLKHFDVNTGRLQRELTAAVEKMKRGHRGAFLAADVIHWMQASWVLASLKYRTNAIRSGFLLQALLTDEKLKHWLGGAVPELARIPADRLERELGAVIEASPESQLEAAAAAAAPSGAPGPRPARRRPRWTSSPSTSPTGPKRATSTRSLAAISRSGKSSTS